MAGLDLYNRKRDFTRTKEPQGKLAKTGGNRFVVQKHAARRLHYDFRLELDGVLKSWAVTRGPSLDPRDKRLAVEVEDHPVRYGGFEGLIPQGEYGGGTVMLWDEGTWEPLEDPKKGLRDGNLKFRLNGQRLKGDWALVRMKPRPQDKGRMNWLLIKHEDDWSRDDDAQAWLDSEAVSIVSGRTMDEIANQSDAVWSSRTGKSGKVTPKSATKSKADMPDFVAPQLATLASQVPQGKDWLHEIKFDGYRVLVRIEDGQARLLTRTGLDWTRRFKPLGDIVQRLPVRRALLDAEVVAVDPETGRADFKALQATLAGEDTMPLQAYVFDLLFLDDEDLRPLPLRERKTRLEALLKGRDLDDRIHFSEHVTEGAAQLKERLCRLDQEGIISKRADSPYRSGRGSGWLKIKCHRRQEFVIGGFTEPSRGGRGIGALLLGIYDGKTLRYAGKVGTGFTHDSAVALRKHLDAMIRQSSPFDDVPATARRGATFVTPSLVAEVRFAEWTRDGHLRHPSYQGLREDKPATAIVREAPLPAQELARTSAAKSETATTKTTSRDKGAIEVDGIRVSSPDRLIFPGTDITKADLAEYYATVADAILPHIAGRPISMIRCPEGAGEDCFFQRHMSTARIPHLKSTGIHVNGRNEDYVMIDDERGLISLVQWGVIEIHPWGCLASYSDKPDRMIFDLDPDPGADFALVAAGAHDIRQRMKEFGLESFLKTTGGKGVHVVVPITPQHGWDAIKAFTRAIAESMANDSPDRFIAKASKAARKGKVFVDYLRNDHTATAVAPYAVRAREGAPVAMPIPWDDLTTDLDPAAYSLLSTPPHLKRRRRDPWDGLLTATQSLSPRVLNALNIAS